MNPNDDADRHRLGKPLYILKPLEEQAGMSQFMSIGAASQLARVRVATIRYYEEIGLLPVPSRTDANRRSYDMATVRRLQFIRRARDLGFDLRAIRQLLTLAGLPDQPCDGADAIARAHLETVRQKLAQLTALRGELEAMVELGAHGRIAECQVIEALVNCEG